MSLDIQYGAAPGTGNWGDLVARLMMQGQETRAQMAMRAAEAQAQAYASMGQSIGQAGANIGQSIGHANEKIGERWHEEKKYQDRRADTNADQIDKEARDLKTWKDKKDATTPQPFAPLLQDYGKKIMETYKQEDEVTKRIPKRPKLPFEGQFGDEDQTFDLHKASLAPILAERKRLQERYAEIQEQMSGTTQRYNPATGEYETFYNNGKSAHYAKSLPTNEVLKDPFGLAYRLDRNGQPKYLPEQISQEDLMRAGETLANNVRKQMVGKPAAEVNATIKSEQDQMLQRIRGNQEDGFQGTAPADTTGGGAAGGSESWSQWAGRMGSNGLGAVRAAGMLAGPMLEQTRNFITGGSSPAAATVAQTAQPGQPAAPAQPGQPPIPEKAQIMQTLAKAVANGQDMNSPTLAQLYDSLTRDEKIQLASLLGGQQ